MSSILLTSHIILSFWSLN